MKSKQKSHVLPQPYDVPSSKCARIFFLISFYVPLYPSLIILRTPHSFHKCNKRYRKRERERRRERREQERPWGEHLGRTPCSSGDAQLLLVHGPGQSQATLNYLLGAIFRWEQKLRRGSPPGKFRTTDRKLIRRARIKTKSGMLGSDE